MNAWSNLAFVVVAFYILYKDKAVTVGQNLLAASRLQTRLYAFSCFLVGAGSFFYHAGFTFEGQWVDVMGMYLAITFFVLYNFQRLGRWKSETFVASYLLTNSVLGYLLYTIPELRRYFFGLFVILLLVVAVLTQRRLKTTINNNLLIKAVVSFAAGLTIWILDLTKILCFPDSWFQGHSLWHLLTALASYYIYAYYRSEDAGTKILQT